MSDYISDNDIIWTDAAGTTRVRVAHEADPVPPEFDGAMPTLRLTPSHYGRPEATQVYGSTDYGFDGPAAWARFAAQFSTRKGTEVFARYVRTFHGSTTVHTHNLGISGEYGYLTFDTTTWWQDGSTEVRQLIAADPTALAVLRLLDETHPANPGDPVFSAAMLPADTTTAALHRLLECHLATTTTTYYGARGWIRTHGAGESFAEYRAYLDGETYGLILERKVRLHISKEDLAYPARPWEDTETDDWEQVDAVWGIYGDDRDNALSSARGNFALDDEDAAGAA